MGKPYTLLVTTDRGEMWTHIDSACTRFLELVRDVDPALPLRDSSWTTRDVAGHVVTVVRRYTRGPTLGDTPRDVDRINRDELATLGEASMSALVDDLELEMKRARDIWSAEGIDLHTRIRFHGGVEIDLAAAFGNLIAEFLIHGRDVAVAAGRPWPIEERDAALILNGMVQILPGYVRRASTDVLRVDISLPGTTPWTLAFDRGTATSEPTSEEPGADVVVRGTAEGLLLTLYARVSPTAAVRDGLLNIGGAQPASIARLADLLEKP